MVEETLSSRLAHIARDFASTEDAHAVSQEIAAAAVDLLDPVSSAGITLVHARRRVETAAASDDLVVRGDHLQYELEEGPCLDAAWEEEQVYAGDLATDDRWPVWAPKVAEELGFERPAGGSEGAAKVSGQSRPS